MEAAQAEPGELHSPAPSVFSTSFALYRLWGLFFPRQKFLFFFFFPSPLISLSIKSLPRANVINLDPKPDA